MDLKALWKTEFQPEIHRQMWDSAAQDYVKKPIPTVDEHSFLKLMQQRGVLQKDASVLDIGCGAGTLTLALAPYVKQAVGCDISEKMIAGAKAQAAELGMDNASFHCLDWHAESLKHLNWEGKFDVVFAHQTPAISDYDTFDKMVRCARKACFFRANTRRHDGVLSQALAQIGIRQDNAQKDATIAYAFAYLWEKGYEPNIQYHKELWHPVKTLDAQIAWTLSRARLCRDITPEEERVIADYLRTISEHGTITETITTTIVTMDWLAL